MHTWDVVVTVKYERRFKVSTHDGPGILQQNVHRAISPYLPADAENIDTRVQVTG